MSPPVEPSLSTLTRSLGSWERILPTHGKEGNSREGRPRGGGRELRGGRQAELGRSTFRLIRILPTVFPGLFWRPVGDGSGWMEKVDHFPGLRPRLQFAHSVKTNPGVNVPSPGMTENNQESLQEDSCRTAGLFAERPGLEKTPGASARAQSQRETFTWE